MLYSVAPSTPARTRAADQLPGARERAGSLVTAFLSLSLSLSSSRRPLTFRLVSSPMGCFLLLRPTLAWPGLATASLALLIIHPHLPVCFPLQVHLHGGA